MKNNNHTAFYEWLGMEIYPVLRSYSNIHRGSGYNSEKTSALYDEARKLVLDHLGLSSRKYQVIFCSPRRAEQLLEGIPLEKYRLLSGSDLGLPLGVRAIALRKGVVPLNLKFFSGGGTARLVSPDWVIWSAGPERFEAGTPAILNVIAFAKALSLNGTYTANSQADKGDSGSAPEHEKDDLQGLKGEMLLRALREKFIGHDLEVDTLYGKRKYINLDNAASTRTFSPVWESYRKAFSTTAGEQKIMKEQARQVIADFTGAPLTDYDIVFTSNTTESISIVAESLSKEFADGCSILNTVLEHNSNDLPWRSFPGLSLLRVGADKNGIVDVPGLESMLAMNHENSGEHKRIRLVSVTGASNVLGTFNNLEEIGKITRRYGARLMVDAAQLIAHRKIEISELGIDYLAFSGHKLYAPFGTGVLIARKGSLSFDDEELSAIHASGEENIGGIASLACSVSYLQRIGLDVIEKEERELAGFSLNAMSELNGIRLFGIQDTNSPLMENRGGVISFSLKDQLSWKVAKRLAESGIGVRAGCHCAHILVKYILDISPFLEKFQGFMLRLLPKLSLPGIVRISLGIENDRKEVEVFLQELQKITAAKSDSP